MRFEKILLADERILFSTRKHIIIFFLPFLLSLFTIAVTVYLINYGFWRNFSLLAWVFWGLSLFLWLQVGVNYWSSQFVVTNKRLLMREGFFVRHSTDLRLSAIAQVNVNQSLLGQLLNYGEVSINAFSVYDAFPLVAKPYTFQKYVSGQVDKIVI